MGHITYFFSHIRYFFSNIWTILTRGRVKSPREKLLEAARKQGYTSVHVVPKKYKGKRKYKKAPAITSNKQL